MNILAFRFTFFMAICLTLASVDGNIPLWALSEPSESAAEYLFETIEVPGVEFLELTSTNDLGHYAGNTRSPDGEKIVGFTLIDGVFSTYDVPGSLKTVFYGLNNAGQAVGFYRDSDEIDHGAIVQDGELTQFDFPGAAQTEIYGISETGIFAGNIIDAAGVIHGFMGDMQIDVPGAIRTYADHVNAAGILVGSYTDADGINHGYLRLPDGSFVNVDAHDTHHSEDDFIDVDAHDTLSELEFLFVNAISDTGLILFRAKAVDDIQRSYILMPNAEPLDLRVPGSVITIARDIDGQGRIAGYYDTQDGRRHGFVAKPAAGVDEEDFNNVYSVSLPSGLNMLSVPLKPATPMTARSLAEMIGATTVIALDEVKQEFVGWTPDAPDDGFPIKGGKGYIVNLLQSRQVTFIGAAWTNQPQVAAAPGTTLTEGTWAFVISGRLESERNLDGYLVIARNLQTDAIMTGSVRGGYFAVATADLSRQSIVEVGDSFEISVTDTTGEIASEKFSFTVTPDTLINAVLSVRLDGVGTPKQTVLLQNYPNPFNPETWIPYHLSEAALVRLSIYDTTGQRIRTLSLGFQAAGFYQSRSRAAYWDGRNDLGEQVSSGVYFYQLSTPSEHQMKRMVIVK